jgi:hypothetical protein
VVRRIFFCKITPNNSMAYEIFAKAWNSLSRGGNLLSEVPHSFYVVASPDTHSQK